MPDQFGNLTPEELTAAQSMFSRPPPQPGPYASGFGAPPPMPPEYAGAMASFAPTPSPQAPVSTDARIPFDYASGAVAGREAAIQDGGIGADEFRQFGPVGSPPPAQAAPTQPAPALQRGEVPAPPGAGATAASAVGGAPSYAGDLKSARGDEMAARAAGRAGKLAEVDATRAQEQVKADVFAEIADYNERKAVVDYAEVQEQQAKLSDYLAKSDALIAAQANRKFDPYATVRSKGLGDDVTSIIGGLLGGMLQGMGKTADNPFLTQTNRMIETEMRRQEQEADNAQRTIGARQNVYGQMRQMFGDAQVAKAQFHQTMLQGFKDKLTSLMAKTEDPIILARGEQALADLDKETAGRREQFATEAQRAAAAQAAARANAARQTLAEQRQAEKDQREFALKAAELSLKEREVSGKERKEAADKFVPTGPGGQGYEAASAEEAKDLRAAYAGTTNALNLIDRIKRTREDTWVTTKALGLPTKNMSSLETDFGLLMGEVNKAEKFGALDKGATDVIKGIIGSPTSWGPGGEAKLEAARAFLESQTAARAMSQGRTVTGQSTKEVAAPASFRAKK